MSTSLDFWLDLVRNYDRICTGYTKRGLVYLHVTGWFKHHAVLNGHSLQHYWKDWNQIWKDKRLTHMSSKQARTTAKMLHPLTMANLFLGTRSKSWTATSSDQTAPKALTRRCRISIPTQTIELKVWTPPDHRKTKKIHEEYQKDSCQDIYDSMCIIHCYIPTMYWQNSRQNKICQCVKGNAALMTQLATRDISPPSRKA